MRTGKGLIDGQLAELRDQPSPPPTLLAMQAPLRANFATLEQIYAVGITKAGYDQRADRLSAVAGRSAGAIEAMLDGAGRDYERRAVRAQNQAGVGSAGVILLLLLAFVVYFRRAAQARAVAPACTARTNGCWPRAATRRSHRRPHRPGQPPRAGRRPRERAAARRRRAPARARALRPRRLQAVQRHASAIRPATRCSPASASAWRPPSTASARRTGWAATSSACSPRSSPAAATSSSRLAAAALSAKRATPSRSAARTAWRSCPSEACDAGRGAAPRRPAHVRAQGRAASVGGRQSTDVLLQVLSERGSRAARALGGVARLAERHRRSARAPRARGQAHPLAAELHDVGKTAIPDDDPQQARPARRRGVGVHAPPHGDRRAHHPRRPVAGPDRRASSAPATSASTAPATPTP